MKNKILTAITLLAAVAITGCSKGEDGTETGAKGTALSISVSLDDFGGAPQAKQNGAQVKAGDTQSGAQAKAETGAKTRATDAGYTTTFEAGDAIGIFATDGTNDYVNVKWVLQTDGVTWKPATDTGGDNGIYYYGTDVTINAYFPYVDGLTALPDPATFEVKADQSTLADYRASDLLLSAPTIWNGNGLAQMVTFSHAMALLEVKPSTRRELQSVTVEAATASGGATTTVTLYNMGDGTLRAALPAQTLDKPIVFTYSDKSFAYSPTNKNLTAAKYTGYTITIPAAVYNYWYADGSYSPEHIEDTQNPCVGIVFRAKTPTEKGLVVSLTEAPSILMWSNLFTAGATNMTDGSANMTTIQNFINTPANSKSWNDFPAMKYIVETMNVQTTYNASRDKWYLPSVGELQHLLCAAAGKPLETWSWSGSDNSSSSYPSFNTGGSALDLSVFNSKLTAAGGTAMTYLVYWSSTEDFNYLAWFVFFNSGGTNLNGKTNLGRVRAVLAF